MTNVRAQLSAADLATLRDIRDDLQREGERIGMPFVRRGIGVLDRLLEADVIVSGNEGQSCLSSHYAAIVEAQKDVEIYQYGDLDCADCLRRMVDKHSALAAVFHARLDKLTVVSDSDCVAVQCRVYDAACLNPIYCDARDACCAGDPDCVPPSGREEDAP